jgi:hypothetical protein
MGLQSQKDNGCRFRTKSRKMSKDEQVIIVSERLAAKNSAQKHSKTLKIVLYLVEIG